MVELIYHRQIKAVNKFFLDFHRMFERVYRKQIIIAVNKTIDFKILP